MKLILASKSEWRKKLLSLLNIPFELVESGVNETSFEWEEASETVATLATMKAEAVGRKLQVTGDKEHDDGLVIIGADTVIAVDGEIIGKPIDQENAKEIIGKLAGKTHEVWTGICVVEPITQERVVEVEKTEVTFRPMNEGQIGKYLESNEWQGKAGAYQLQGLIKPYVKDIVGSYTNVIGLPMLTLVEMLERVGVGVEVDIKEVLDKALGQVN